MKTISLKLPNRIIIGNWKMNPKTLKEATAHFKAMVKVAEANQDNKYVVLVPMPFFETLSSIKQKVIDVGIQNIHHELFGAYTGDVALSMVPTTPSYVLVGHSERRSIGETDIDINKKILICVKKNVHVVVCIGEKNRDQEALFFATIREQLETALENVPKKDISHVIFAYEPIWAVGKDARRSATPEEIFEVVIYIKKVLFDLYGESSRNVVKILYGGSTDSKNAQSFLVTSGVDGFLLGRASLDIKEYKKICEM